MAREITVPKPKPLPKGQAEALEDPNVVADGELGDTNAKKESPYGPPFPALYDYFHGKR